MQVYTSNLDPSRNMDRADKHPELLPTEWPANATISEWWQNITSTQDTPRKASRSLTLLVSWEVWKERNDRFFDRKESLVPSIVNKIKGECSIWIVVGAKCLASFFYARVVAGVFLSRLAGVYKSPLY
jgi:hypothetical protein